MDSTLYNGQCRDCGAPLIDCKCHLPSNEAIEEAGEMKTLEQSLEELRTHRDKAAKYDALCERFPFWPGDTCYVLYTRKIRSIFIVHISDSGVRDAQGVWWHFSECYHTADACRAAIPVE